MSAAGASYNFRNQELAVAGGGDTAAEEAVYLTKYASKVGLPSTSRWGANQGEGLRLSPGADLRDHSGAQLAGAGARGRHHRAAATRAGLPPCPVAEMVMQSNAQPVPAAQTLAGGNAR